MATADDVIAAARGWIDVPWRHQGRNRLGIDCVGVMAKVAHELDLSEYDNTVYPRRPVPGDFLAIFRDHLDEIVPVSERQIGDILLFRDRATLCHAGFFTTKDGLPHLLHATAATGQVVEEPFTRDWELKLLYCFRYRGLDPSIAPGEA